MMQLKSFLIVALFLSSSIFAKVFESKNMSEILPALKQDAVVVFDLDNTIMEAAQMVGSDQWFEHRLGQHQKQGLAIEDAVSLTAKEWEAVNEAGRVKLVEGETPTIIQLIQDRGIPTMGLTARHARFLEQSLNQLDQLGVHFDRYTISNSHLFFNDKDKAEFTEGLMAVGGNNKGSMLIALLQKVGYKPSRVLFVDDKVKNTNNVDLALNTVSIPSFAFRYGGADETVKSFDPKLADFEFEYFKKTGIVLTDARARRLMQ